MASPKIKLFLLSILLFVGFFLMNVKQTNAQVKLRKAVVYTTSKDLNQRLQITDTISFGSQAQPLETEICIFLDSSKKFQEMIGIGAALTDASAETFAKVSKEAQEELVRAFYNPTSGIGYTLMRTNMNSCDFSSGTYTYVPEGDSALKNFSIAHDLQYRVPLIKLAFNMSQNNMKLYVSPWSPPAFMKDNNNMLQGGKLLPQYRQSWANYFVKYIQSYEKAGIPVWGLSIQNEPMAKQRWESCIFTAEEERDFLKYYLGPTLAKSKLGNKKIIVWDHNRDLIFQRANVILSDPEAAKYAWGVGYHWYETWTGGAQLHENLDLVQECYPNKKLLFTEGCKESFNPEKYSSWAIGEYYAEAMIKDFNQGVCGWTDWNIFLDETGGPNHVGNFCFAPVHVNTQTSKITYTNAYYYIGHFSKFIRPGNKRIACSSSRSTLMATAYIQDNGKIAVIVMNKGEEKINYTVQLKGQSIAVSLAPHSIQTIVF